MVLGGSGGKREGRRKGSCSSLPLGQDWQPQTALAPASSSLRGPHRSPQPYTVPHRCQHQPATSSSAMGAPSGLRPLGRTKHAPAERALGISPAVPSSEDLLSGNTTSSHLLPSPAVAARSLISDLPQHPFFTTPPTHRSRPLSNTFVINCLYYLLSSGNSWCNCCFPAWILTDGIFKRCTASVSKVIC